MSKIRKAVASNTPTPITSLTHTEAKRANIPTEELRDFMAEDEKAPKTVLYPRDPSLDPQLVWRGKDEQDAHPLEVPSVPIYIQEKIHPQAIVENLRETAKAGEQEPELRLFNDFNGIKFEDLIEFYHHEQSWQNRMILGDSLLVMNSLAEKEGLRGKVQAIYFDPPYGIKFGSNWQVKTDNRDVSDGKISSVTAQPEQVKAFRDTWENGVHSYLSYMRERLVCAHSLLSQSGSLFVQIGDENVHLIRTLLDEVFGSANFVSTISYLTTSGHDSLYLANTVDFVLLYAKEKSNFKFRQLYLPKEMGVDKGEKYRTVELEDGTVRPLTEDELLGKEPLPTNSKVFTLGDLTSNGWSEVGSQPLQFRGTEYQCPSNSHWKTTLTGINRLGAADRLAPTGKRVMFRRRIEDFSIAPINNQWTDTSSGFSLSDPKVYVVQTRPLIVERCILMATDPGDLVLDPTCGSGTTAYVAEEWGRRWITIDTSRVALALARTRLMAAKFPYYLLKDTSEGRKRELELTFGAGVAANLPSPAPPASGRGDNGPDIRQGFVYKRVPHITLKSIANNEEIDVIYARYESQMSPILAELNKLTKSNWQDWEVPRELPLPGHPLGKGREKSMELLEQWWKLRRARQKEIDDSIARRADVEFLYDQPEEDKKRIRVTGPFTVESLSPHRMLSLEESPIASTIDALGAPEPELAAGPGKTSPTFQGGGRGVVEAESDFVTVILDNLRKASIQTTKKDERLKFDRIEPLSNPWIHAKGVYTDKDGKERIAAITIGPEHGTVSPDLVREAAKAAVQSIEGFDSLYILGFSFDPYVDTERTKLGKLTVVMTRMNPDLSMGDELLKKTGAGNLFMVFGEPDIKIEKSKSGTFTVEIHGLDVYDPTTGAVRSDSTDDIACWFIDTNYNGESFFVRHAYFTGSNEPYDRLKRALRAEIDEAAWSSLYSTVSRPFDAPKTGKIAVKVINHYGDEVLRVYECK